MIQLLLFQAMMFASWQLTIPELANEIVSLKEIRNLSPQAAEQRWPVRLTLTATYVDPEFDFLFAVNGEQAIFLHGAAVRKVSVGDRFKVKGTTDYEICTFVQADEICVLGKAGPAKPTYVDAAAIHAKRHDSKLIQTTLRIKQVTILNRRALLCAEANGQPIFINVAAKNRQFVRAFTTFITKRTQVTGNLGYLIDVAPFYKPGQGKQPKILGFQLFVDNLDDLKMVNSNNDLNMNFFPTPLSKLSTIDNTCFGAEVNGQVTYVGDDFFILQCGECAKRINAFNTNHLEVGHSIVALICRDVYDQYEAVVIRPNYFNPSLPEPIRPSRGEISSEQPNLRRAKLTGTVKRSFQEAGRWVVEIQIGRSDSSAEVVFPKAFSTQVDMNTIRTISVVGVFLPNSSSTNNRLHVARAVDLQIVSRRSSFPFGLVTSLIAVSLIGVAFATGLVKHLRKSIHEKNRELKAVNAQLQRSNDAMKDGLLVCDQAGRIINSNSSLWKILDVQPTLVTSASQVFEIFGGQLDSENLRVLNDFLLGDGADNSVELVTNSKPPRYVLIERNSINEICDDKTEQDNLWVVRDVSDNRQLQSSLLQVQKMEAIGTFTGGIAHDFNNLLTPIALNLSVIRSAVNDDSELVNEVDSCEQSIFRAAGVVRQLLTFSQNKPLQLHPCCVNSTIEQCKNLLRFVIDSTIETRFHFQKSLPLVQIDKTVFEQVLVNLFLNAKDAMPLGGTIEINTYLEKHLGSSRVVVTIKDQGEGIPAECQERVFEPFFTTKEAGKGSGLGLAVSYVAIRRHGGELTFNTWKGEGTEFKITLPVSEEVASIPSQKTRPLRDIKLSHRVLLIDDEWMVRNSTAKVLRKFGCEVFEAADGKTGIDLFHDLLPAIDCVLLDLKMPNMDGWEVLKELKQLNGTIPVVICSGYIAKGCPEDSVNFLLADAVLQKPFSTTELANTIEKVISLSGEAPSQVLKSRPVRLNT